MFERIQSQDDLRILGGIVSYSNGGDRKGVGAFVVGNAYFSYTEASEVD